MDSVMRRQVATHPVAARLAPIAPPLAADEQLHQQYAHHLNPASPLGEPVVPLGGGKAPPMTKPAPRDDYLDGFERHNGHSKRPTNPLPNFNAGQQLLAQKTGATMRHDMSIVEKAISAAGGKAAAGTWGGNQRGSIRLQVCILTRERVPLPVLLQGEHELRRPQVRLQRA